MQAATKWTTEFRSTKKNVLTDTLQKEYYEIYDVNGDYFAFTTYENCSRLCNRKRKEPRDHWHLELRILGCRHRNG